MRQILLALAGLSLFTASCGSKAVRLPRQDFNPAPYVRDVDTRDLAGGKSSTDLGDVRFRTGICAPISIQPQTGRISAAELQGFLQTQGIGFQVASARLDLTYLDIPTLTGTVRLRVATLPTAREAARHLHEALLEHGSGAWGIHRANVAVLGPAGSTQDVLAFALRTRLACWGVLTIAGRDDSFVVPGAYTEL